MEVAPWVLCTGVSVAGELEEDFIKPPDSARPGVYWYFMDGNMNGKELTADLESMKNAGLGNLVFLEVDIGMPKGPVKFMSEPWQELFAMMVHAAERLGIDISLGTGPGWCGSGGPWVTPEQSMQHLVFSVVEVTGPQNYSAMLPLPEQRSTEFHTLASPYYADVAVWALPNRKAHIADIADKALFLRGPFSIWKSVMPQPCTSTVGRWGRRTGRRHSSGNSSSGAGMMPGRGCRSTRGASFKAWKCRNASCGMSV
jgi:hypothetical protein